MIRNLPLLICAVILATPSAFAGGPNPPSIVTSRMDSSGTQSLAAEEAWVKVAGSPATFVVTGQAANISGVAYDETRLVVRDPLIGFEPVHRTERDEEPVFGSSATFSISSFDTPDATLLVVPTEGAHSVTTANDGTLDSQSMGRTVIQRHPAYESRPVGTTYYFEYAVDETVQHSLGGRTTHTVSGDFLIFLWGVTFSVADAAGTTSISTGIEYGAGQTATSEERHYAYATLNMVDAALTIVVEDFPSTLYGAGESTIVAGTTRLENAVGDIIVGNVQYQLQGSEAILVGGSYAVDRESESLRVGVTKQPSAVVGPPGSSIDSPNLLGNVGLWLLWGPLIGLTVVGGTMAAPRLFPTLRLRSSMVLPLDAADSRVQKLASRASLAESRGDFAEAEKLVSAALKITPDDPDLHLTRALFLRGLGRYAEAVEHHRRAHESFRLDPAAPTAHNAYEAARTSTLMDQPESALAWLQMAIDHDSELAQAASEEPDFGRVKETAEFRRIMKTAAVEFWRRP